MAHTPGPWRAFPSRGEILINGSSIYHVYDICSTDAELDACVSRQCNPADITLMAAAPELLTALREIADGCEYRLRKGGDSGDEATLRLCRAALNKAEGRSE